MMKTRAGRAVMAFETSEAAHAFARLRREDQAAIIPITNLGKLEYPVPGNWGDVVSYIDCGRAGLIDGFGSRNFDYDKYVYPLS